MGLAYNSSAGQRNLRGVFQQHHLQELRKWFVFLQMEFSQLQRDILTRWLALCNALAKLLGCWPAVKQYFLN
jgi:hypothetical protein